MAAPILYLGDTSLETAASYLAGVIDHAGWLFEYVPSDVPANRRLFENPRALFILSDFPAEQLSAECQSRLVEAVRNGSGLLMIGGWESFHGCGGNWDATPVAEALPVEISDQDDRRNCDQPAMLRALVEHPVTANLPWIEHPPTIGGLNRFTPRPDAEVLLEGQHFRVRLEAGEFSFEATGSDPMLVVGQHGEGRTAALATDAAPHWVGGLVDWGQGRVAAQAPGAEAIEVGDMYTRFLQQLLAWTGNLVPNPR